MFALFSSTHRDGLGLGLGLGPVTGVHSHRQSSQLKAELEKGDFRRGILNWEASLFIHEYCNRRWYGLN